MRIVLSIFAGVAAFALPWMVRLWRTRRWGLPVLIKVDPDAPSADAIAGYFAAVARRLDERPERMSVVIDGCTAESRSISLDFTPDGSMCVTVEGDEPKKFGLRRRWIPDHPVPLMLRSCRLWIEPVDSNRFRVMDALPFRVPPTIYAMCSLLAAIGVACVLPECIASAVGLAVGCLSAQTVRT